MLIGEVQKNAMEKIRVALERFKGREFLDLRIYYEDDGGEWRPTKKGITIALDKVSEVMDLLKDAQKEIDKKGSP